MKKGNKRFGAMMLATALTIGSLGGCGQSGNEEKQTQAEGTQLSESIEGEKESNTTEPITISVMTTRHDNATNDANEVWIFKYLEYWLREQGYNVTIDAQQTMDTAQQVPLLIGTDSLPDLMWGIQLDPSDEVTYGQDEGMILDWAPYLNEETMPNLYNLLSEEDIAAISCSDGGIYGLPYVSQRKYRVVSGTYSTSALLYINTKWLQKCNLDMPTDLESFLNVMRTFKEDIELENGAEVIPALSLDQFFAKFLWACLGYYGSGLSEFGTELAIKDGEVSLPASTEDYRTFIEIMKICYDEGLISQDYFTMDKTTVQGLIQSGTCGVLGDITLGYTSDFSEWAAVPLFALGDNDELLLSTNPTVTPGRIWASADTKYPELLAKIMDYLYSPEGSTYYYYGPQKGQDPLEMLDGWYYNEDGVMTTKLVEDGTFSSYGLYCMAYVYPYDSTFTNYYYSNYSRELAGVEAVAEEYTVTDALTGKPFACQITKKYTDDNADGWWRITCTDAYEKSVTTVRLPSVRLTEEDSLRSAELKTVLEQYIQSESAKFITGLRPLSELDAYFEELEKMGVEEYVEIYQNGYCAYIDGVFGK